MHQEYTHREAIAALDGGELVALKTTANGPGLVRLAFHFGWLAATSAVILLAPNAWILLPALLLHGIALIFLFSLEHECIHGTAFRDARLNTTLAEAAGFLLLLPPRYFRYFHFAHHRHTQDAARDPELASPRPRNVGEYLRYLTGLPYWRAQISMLFGAAFGRADYAFVPQGGRATLILEARAYLAAYAVLALASLWQGWTWPLTLWIVPALIGSPFCAPISSPNMPPARWLPTCWPTPAPPSPAAWSISWPGTCRITRRTMPFPWCPSTGCRPSPPICNGI